MDSLNNWLGFSLASHLSGVQHMSEETGTAGTTTSSPNIGVDFNSSGDGGRHRQEQQCFNLLASSSSLNGVAEDPSPFQTDQGCSFTIFNALGQNHNSDWSVDSLEENRQQQQQHYLQATNGINSTLYDPHHHYPPQLLQQQQQQQQHESGMGRTNNSTSIVAPKLEDFLGGSNNINTNNSNSNSNSHSHSSNSTTANHEAEKSSNSSSFVSSSYSQRQQQGGTNNATRDLLFHDYDSRLPLIPGYDSNYHLLSAEAGHNMHHSSTQAASATMGLSIMKSWLRSQNNTSSSSPITPAVQSLSLSMSIPTIKSSCNINKGISTTSLVSTTTATTETAALTAAESSSDIVPAVAVAETVAKPEGGGGGELELEIVPKKSIDNFGQRTSIYRGVTKHRWTGRYEAHLWDNSCRREGQTRKGRQVYLGGYDSEEKAARAYDLAALKYWGPTTTINFPLNDYENELEEMKHKTRQEFVASLRRKSTGFSRGASIYRGVTRHHQHGRWQARIGRVAGNKDLYLGTFSTQEEAAEAYDIAAIKFRGVNAVTNFEASRYDIAKICSSSSLPIAALVKRNSLDQQPRLYDDIALGSLYAMQPTRPSSWQLLGYTPPQLPIQAIPAHHHYSKPWGSTTQLSQEEEEASFPLSLTNTNTNLQLQNQLMATFDVSVSPFSTTFPTFLSNSGTNNHNTSNNGMFLASGAAPSSSSSSSSPSEQALAAAMVNIGGGFADQGNPCHVDQQLLSQLPHGSDTCLPARNLFYSRQPFGSIKPSSSYGNYGLENDSGGTHHEWVTTVPTYADWN